MSCSWHFDGLRLLGATERIGDFSLAVVSKTIQPEFTKFTANSTSFSSITIREKSQYRIFGFNAGFADDSALGIIGTQFAAQGGEGMAWAETRGINFLLQTVHMTVKQNLSTSLMMMVTYID